MCNDDVTIGVTDIVNNIQVTAQPNDQIIDINVTDNSDEVTLNVTPTVIEVNVNKGSSFARWGAISGNILDQSDLTNALFNKADLVDGKVPSNQLPSYVDDVIEVANYAALPTVGEIGKIYITLDDNKIYRWSGSIYIEIASNQAIWGAITGSLTNQTDLVNALNLKANISGQVFTGAISATNLSGTNTGDQDLSGLVPNTRTLTINGTTFDLSANRTYTIPTHDAVTLGTANGLSLSGQVLSLGLAGASSNGALSSTDWNTFNNKLSSLSGAVLTTTNQSISGEKKFLNIQRIDSETLLKQNLGWSFQDGYTTLAGRVDGIVISSSLSSTAILNLSSLTGSKTFSFPDATGTLALTSQLHNAVTIGTANGLSLNTQVLSLSLASASANGALSSTDWNTFNNKQNALTNPITGTGTTNFLSKFTASGTIGNSQIFDNGTNVGIGTTSPSNKLHVLVGNIDGIRVENSNSGFIELGKTAGSRWRFANDYNVGDGLELLYGSGGATPTTSRLTVTSGGNVGIGTTSPAVKFHSYGGALSVGDESSYSARFSNNSNKGVVIGYDSTNNKGHIGSINPAVAWTDLILNANGGNVGIGTTSPTKKLEVAGSSLNSLSGQSIEINPYWDAGYSAIGTITNHHLAFVTNVSEKMRITSSGDVCVGTTTANSRFNVTSPFGNTVTFNNTSGFSDASFLVFQASGNAIGGISRVGTTNAVSYNTTSDYRLKEDLKKVKGLELISKIKVYDFKWKNHIDRMDGVLAHELQEVVPYAVTGERDAEQMQSVDYSKLVPILVQAIQEQQKQIEELKTLINK